MRVSNLRYDLALAVPAGKEEPIVGTLTATFDLADRDTPLAFDFAPDRSGLLRSVTRNGMDIPVRQVNGHVIVARESLEAGENSLTFNFNAGSASLNRNDDFLYTIFVPGPRAPGVPLFRSAGSEGAVDAGARRSRRLGGGRRTAPR